ncbi:8-amino-7-oxononanoate synthase [gut metagenome]|uniref:8-amino-7-oxononanoate synthase n=1 Tax=gut metagenome TaxID=749906 RepID=J9FH70_9ZZZZ
MWERMAEELEILKQQGNFRTLPPVMYPGYEMVKNGEPMLNLSSNDYLGLASRQELREEFLQELSARNFLPTSSSSRLLTGNFPVYEELENELARLYNKESALVLNSGYHANTGILPAISTEQTLILADKLVHASLIDGIRLSNARCIRYRHNDMLQLERLIKKYEADYREIIVVTESLFSMDGDITDLWHLSILKKTYPKLLLYVDEAHAFGVRGSKGLGLAEEMYALDNIDFLVGTFGKAVASAGAFIVCKKIVKEYLVNRMRTLIFTTALPPVNIAWTLFILRKLPDLKQEREHLATISKQLRQGLEAKKYVCPSTSHIVPLIIGSNEETIWMAEKLQKNGFYTLPVRPPTVPEGTSRIRFSLTADMSEEDVEQLLSVIDNKP